PHLEDIINKSLEKDRNLRYQHAADVRADLQRLKRDTDSGRALAQSSGSIPAAPDTSAVKAPSAPTMLAHPSAPSQAVAAPGSGTGVVPSARSRWQTIVPIAAGVLVGLIVAGWYLRSRTTTKLTEKDSVLLADFVNTTGDAVFDGTL